MQHDEATQRVYRVLENVQKMQMQGVRGMKEQKLSRIEYQKGTKRLFVHHLSVHSHSISHLLLLFLLIFFFMIIT